MSDENMTAEEFDRRANAGESVCMIFRRNPRVVATACLGCGLSEIACQAQREYEAAYCCPTCDH